MVETAQGSGTPIRLRLSAIFACQAIVQDENLLMPPFSIGGSGPGCQPVGWGAGFRIWASINGFAVAPVRSRVWASSRVLRVSMTVR